MKENENDHDLSDSESSELAAVPQVEGETMDIDPLHVPDIEFVGYSPVPSDTENETSE